MTLASDPSKTVPTASAPLSLPNPEASKQMLRLIREDKAHGLLRDWDDHLDDSYALALPRIEEVLMFQIRRVAREQESQGRYPEKSDSVDRYNRYSDTIR